MTELVHAHPRLSPPQQEREEPGLDTGRVPEAVHGEASYVAGSTIHVNGGEPTPQHVQH